MINVQPKIRICLLELGFIIFLKNLKADIFNYVQHCLYISITYIKLQTSYTLDTSIKLYMKVALKLYKETENIW